MHSLKNLSIAVAGLALLVGCGGSKKTANGTGGVSGATGAGGLTGGGGIAGGGTGGAGGPTGGGGTVGGTGGTAGPMGSGGTVVVATGGSGGKSGTGGGTGVAVGGAGGSLGGGGGVTSGGTAGTSRGGSGGGVTSIPDAGTPIPGTGADFANRVADAFCKFYVSCGFSPSIAACQSDYFASSLIDFSNISRGIDSGRILYDVSKAGPCFDVIAQSPCQLDTLATQQKTSAGCMDLLRGKVPAGGGCVDGAECVTGVCHQPSCGVSCCLGTCGEQFPAGAACESSSDCMDGNFCDFSSSSSRCKPEMAAGQPCNSSSSCQIGLVCDVSGSKTCVPRIADGQACAVDGVECESLASFCDPDTGKCRRRLPVGSACSIPDGGVARVSAGCVYYAACVGGTCAELPPNGQPCSVLDGGSSYLVCRAGQCTGGTCQPYETTPCTMETAQVPDAGARD
jgi:hypothetical protein